MEPVRVIEGAVTVLDRDDVDTDQIIPKQFLKRVERTGFGEFLLLRLGARTGWDLPANPILVDRAQLRLRLEPRARAVGAAGLRLPGDHRAGFADIFRSNCTKNGLLPVELAGGRT